MWNNKKDKDHKNPDGLTRDEFLMKYKDIEGLAKICWYYGIYPEQLKKEIETLLKKDSEELK